jgi:hypothetical protein
LGGGDIRVAKEDVAQDQLILEVLCVVPWEVWSHLVDWRTITTRWQLRPFLTVEVEVEVAVQPLSRYRYNFCRPYGAFFLG